MRENLVKRLPQGLLLLTFLFAQVISAWATIAVEKPPHASGTRSIKSVISVKPVVTARSESSATVSRIASSTVGIASASVALKERLPSLAAKLGRLRGVLQGIHAAKPVKVAGPKAAVGPKKAGIARSVAAGKAVAVGKSVATGKAAAGRPVSPGRGPVPKSIQASSPISLSAVVPARVGVRQTATGTVRLPASSTASIPATRGFFKVPAATSASGTIGVSGGISTVAAAFEPVSVKPAPASTPASAVIPVPAQPPAPEPISETFSEAIPEVGGQAGFGQSTGNDQEERRLNISGTKSFEMKNAKVKGDIGHFSTENFDSIPGFRLDQSLHLEIDGELSRHTKVNAVLDDKEDQDRRFTVFVDGSVWDLTIGDFPLALKDVEFVLHNKEVRGIMAAGAVHPNWKTMFLFSQSKGMARREQFRGAGQQQEFRLLGKPVVQNSERITIDGRLLLRGTDYLFDYEEGILKFQPHLLPIEATSWVVIEYEVTDEKLAFKRNLYGGRVMYEGKQGKRFGMSVLREVDASTPKSENPASSTATPMEHTLVGVDGAWTLNKTFSVAGEHSMSFFDPNSHTELASGDRTLVDGATRLTLLGKSERLDGELGFRQIGRDFKLVGREGGVAEIGERGLVRDVRKGNGRFTYRLRPAVSLFGGLEKSETNVSQDPALSSIDFLARNVGVTWKYRDRSQFETRWERHSDRETKGAPLTDRDKDFGAMVWDHDFGSVFVQSKLERTAYEDALAKASGSQVLQFQTSLGSDKNKRFAWSTGYSRLNTEDESTPGRLRQAINNYTFDLNFDPNRVFNARGIFQWRTEKDYLTKIDQDDQVADSRFRYQPNPDLTTQFKYKVENTTKIVRDPSIDPAKYVRPPTLPLQAKDQEEVVSRFENPVQKQTANFSTNYRLGEKAEAYFDWKRRDVRDRATRQRLSHNDRETYELKYSPIRQVKLTAEYEDGVIKNQTPISELRDTVKRIEARNEFYEGYVMTGRWEDRDENDIHTNDNDRRTQVKGVDFARVFSPAATLEFGIARNVIDQKLPSKEWEQKAAFILTPARKNQRYKLFFAHKSIEAAKSGTHYEGGLNFSQFIGTDSILDGELKRVSSTAGINGSGYDGTIANAKMIITF